MENRRFSLGISVLALAFGVAVLGACASSKYTVMNEPIEPDNQSAVVLFYGSSGTKAEVWDGEKPVGTFDGGPRMAIGCMPWRTMPGSHTFVAKSSNYVNVKMNLRAGKTYYAEVYAVPSPPYTTLIVMKELTQEEEEAYRKRWRIQHISYSDEWRENFLAYQNGKRLKDIQEYLKDIK